jgi:RNAse (barnase) inhibitor barstar
MGHSLDAFNDALVGGLSDDGIIYREPAEIVWLNSSKSKSELLNDFDEVKEMIEAHGHHLVLS